MIKYPRVKNGIISRTEGNIFSYHGWGSVCKATNGELLAVCSAFRMKHVCPFGKTALYRSTDNGLTWSAPTIINDTLLDDRDAGIISLGGDRLLVTWFIHPPMVYTRKYRESILNDCNELEKPITEAHLNYWEAKYTDPTLGGSFIRISEDLGRTWGETIRIPISAPHGPTMRSDGSLIYFGKELYSFGAEKEHALAVYVSHNEGKRWKRLSYIENPEGFKGCHVHEPHIIELKDGTHLGAIRVEGDVVPYRFTVYTTKSKDGGKTWSPLKPTEIEGSPPHLFQHSSGAVLLSVGHRSKPYGQKVYVSYDGGDSFEDVYIIRDDAPDDDLGYPATIELDDGSLITVYYQRYHSDIKTSFLYSKWRLDDIR
ncbi:MAG TPA: sialidase family protein [Clostridiales bacterium]|nr:sialidase family protein [Clostridiales bacterium]